MRRAIPFAFAAAALLALAACGGPLASVAAVTHQPPLAASALQVTTPDGRVISPGGWTNQPDVRLSATFGSPDAGAELQPQAEVVPADQAFTGVPNALGGAGASTILLPTGLLAAGQTYHWQVRAHEVGGKDGPWVPWAGSLGFDPSPPPSPSVTPLPNDGWIGAKPATIQWDAIAGKSGIAGFAYSVDKDAAGQPPTQANTNTPSATVNPSQDGDWFFHVRTLTNAGSWSPIATLALHRDSAPIKIADVLYRTFAYNPGIDTLHIAFSLNKAAASTTVTIIPDKADTILKTFPFKNQDKVDIQWDGKDDKGAAVAPGNYRFRVVAQDRGGNTLDATYDKLLITNKRIVVSLSQQKLWAYEGDKVFLESLVTTGNQALPTPTGTFQILTKQPDFVFHSPWPKGDKFWYPDSPTHFAMMFDDGGYFIHDAPWRHKFGPGSNLVAGQPGEDITGTHGCVNMPLDAQTKLFAWTDPGTPVIIQD